MMQCKWHQNHQGFERPGCHRLQNKSSIVCTMSLSRLGVRIVFRDVRMLFHIAQFEQQIV
jgi:hypothetical protein